MKKILVITFLFILVFFLNGNYLAHSVKIVVEENQSKLNKSITIEDFILYFGKKYDSKIPDSYNYIDVKIKGVYNGTEIYKNLQKLIYANVFKNSPIYLKKHKNISTYYLYRFAEKNYNLKIISDNEIKKLKSNMATFKDLQDLDVKILDKQNNIYLNIGDNNLEEKKKIFSDVYKIISSSHYGKDYFDNGKLLEGATKALAESTGDKYTVYFPALDNKNFNESLNGEYQGIGAYVDMQKPGIFTIISPIPDSPAEKSGLKGGDIVTHVDKKEITKQDSISEIVSLIKGKAGTSVLLTIKRGSKIFDLSVKRGKISLKEIESKKINSSTYYIRMNFFGPNISKEFKKSLEILKTDKNIKKIIFDLRGNGGGYLNQVSDILGNFVPYGDKTAIVKYSDYSQNYYSRGYDDIDFSKYRIILLENSGTASASEIFIGTLKDYLPESTIIGERSFGKGSVQTVKNYIDGSSLKYTIAKWYTGKTETGIDGVGIEPDIEIPMESYGVDDKDDLQLNKAIKIK